MTGPEYVVRSAGAHSLYDTSPANLEEGHHPVARTTQLRTYTVRDGMLDEWVERWRMEIVPLRLELGFTIGGAWVDRERNHFVWLISYDGPEAFAERNAMYWSSPARKAMNLDPDDYLVHTDDRTVEERY